MLGTTTVVTTQLGTIAQTEFIIRNEEKIELDATALGQLGDEQTLVIQQFKPLGSQQMGVTDPDIEIRAATLAYG